MSNQLNLLAEASQPVEVPICRAVLHSGASARLDSGARLLPHLHLPADPSAALGDGDWLEVLEQAECALRQERPAVARLDLGEVQKVSGYSGRGGPGRACLTASSSGVQVGHGDEAKLIRWPGIHRALRERREIEPAIGRARDLAEAYRLLDYYGRIYESFPWPQGWTPVPLISRLSREARDLGGDPVQLQQHTTYIREGTAT